MPEVRNLAGDAEHFIWRGCASRRLNAPEGEKEYKHKIVDWEAGALFWKMHAEHGPTAWESKFRSKIEIELTKKDLMFLMGNQHGFPDQWLIVSLIYPPKRTPADDGQIPLL